MTGPTQFDSSMFVPLQPTDSPLATGTSTPEAGGSDSKSKHKKKKKKNKKHKHKHKHERLESDKGKEKSDSGSQSQRHFSEGIILDQPFSSDASNSPARKPPDSPDFEVI